MSQCGRDPARLADHRGEGLFHLSVRVERPERSRRVLLWRAERGPGPLRATQWAQALTPEEALEQYPDVEGTFDIALAFVTHSDMDQGCSSWLAAAALAHLTGGVLLDESSGDAIPGAGAIEWAREQEKAAADFR